MSGRFNRRKLRYALLSPANLPAAIAVLVVSVFGIFADHLQRAVHREALRAEVLMELSLVRARLEGSINGTIQLVKGLVAVVATEPDMGQARFEELTGTLFRGGSPLRAVAGAPDLVVRLMYPLQGNEQAVGLDYNRNEAQRAAALRARNSTELVVAGPVDLIQGGRGFIGRFPVFLDATRSNGSFWGLVSAVIDEEKLYRDSGLFDPALKIDIAIRGKDALGDFGDHFFGNPKIFLADPVTADVVLPFGSWRVAAMPKGGWDTVPASLWLMRLFMTLVAIGLAVPLLMLGHMYRDRQRSFIKLRRRKQQLKIISRRLELALDVSRIGVWEMDIKTGVVTWDEQLRNIYKLEVDRRLTSADWEAAVHPEDREAAILAYRKAVETRSDYASEFRIVLDDGTVKHLRTRATFYEDDDGATKMIGAEWDTSEDIALNQALERAKTLAEEKSTALQSANRRIEYNALHDSLTELPNRRYLDARLDEWRQQKAGQVALLHIDLDRFKQINDTLGHAAGDAMLVHASSVLKANVCPNDFVARIGGDEFVVVCRDGMGDGRLAELATRIIERMRQPVIYHGHECRFGVSIGIARSGDGDFDPRRLVVNADIALYRAKSRGRNRFEFFTDQLQEEIVSTKRTADEILCGLERDEFEPYFQPQFDARTLEIVGVEALARWRHPTRGLLGPDAFLKIAEELNVVAVIDRLILEKTLAQFAEWERLGLGIPNVSVNVSARRLQEDELVKSLRALDIRPGTVSFELVESIFLDDNDEVIVWNVEQIKELGIDIEIDDFGTGYASIVSLLKLKPKRLKLDRQLVMPIEDAPAQRHIVQSMIEIGRSLDIEVIAEGVETLEHARILRDLGCDMLQGYAFAPAMSAQAFIDFVQSRAWRKAS